MDNLNKTEFSNIMSAQNQEHVDKFNLLMEFIKNYIWSKINSVTFKWRCHIVQQSFSDMSQSSHMKVTEALLKLKDCAGSFTATTISFTEYIESIYDNITNSFYEISKTYEKNHYKDSFAAIVLPEEADKLKLFIETLRLYLSLIKYYKNQLEMVNVLFYRDFAKYKVNQDFIHKINLYILLIEKDIKKANEILYESGIRESLKFKEGQTIKNITGSPVTVVIKEVDFSNEKYVGEVRSFDKNDVSSSYYIDTIKLDIPFKYENQWVAA